MGAILDPIISTLGTFYQEPVCLPPLDPDPDTNGKPADHLIVMMNPVDNVNNKPSRTFREVRIRPLRQGGMEKLKNWFQAQEWGEVIKEESVDKKAEILHDMILDKVDEFCPEKTRKLASDDKPWFTEELNTWTHLPYIAVLKSVHRTATVCSPIRTFFRGSK